MVNKEKYREYQRNYQRTTKRKEYLNTKIICECGANYLRGNRASHLKSAKHADLLFKKNNPEEIQNDPKLKLSFDTENNEYNQDIKDTVLIEENIDIEYNKLTQEMHILKLELEIITNKIELQTMKLNLQKLKLEKMNT